MKLAFNPFPRNLTGFVSCVAFALTALAGIEARSAVTYNADSNQALARSLASGMIVDWNLEFHMVPAVWSEDEDRPEVACLSVEELDSLAIVRKNESADISDTNASDDGDYMEYKYGRYGRYFGGSSNLNPSAAQATEDAFLGDFSTQSDDPNNLDNTAANDGNQWQSPIDDVDPGMTPGYHYMAVEEQVGRNEGSKAKGDDDDDDKPANPKEGVKSKDDGDDSDAADDDCTEDSDDDSPESGAFTDAVLGVTGLMADEWAGERYGMKFSDVGRLIGAAKK